MISRVQKRGIWHYNDPRESAFVFEMWNAGISLESIDDFIEGTQGVTLPANSRADLLAERAQALAAYVAGDFALAESRARGLHKSCTILGLQIAAIPRAIFAEAFIDHAHKKRGGPIRREIARHLAVDPTLKNPQLWAAVIAKLPRGWKAFDNSRVGKYLEGPGREGMGQARFFTVCGEERNKLQN